MSLLLEKPCAYKRGVSIPRIITIIEPDYGFTRYGHQKANGLTWAGRGLVSDMILQARPPSLVHYLRYAYRIFIQDYQ